LLQKEMGGQWLPAARPSQGSGGTLFASRLPISRSISRVAHCRLHCASALDLIARNRERRASALRVGNGVRRAGHPLRQLSNYINLVRHFSAPLCSNIINARSGRSAVRRVELFPVLEKLTGRDLFGRGFQPAPILTIEHANDFNPVFRCFAQPRRCRSVL
jgi:hypothetical protein